MRDFHQKNSSRSAFTLIEILVVLAIIGILAAMLFPALRSAREKAYQTSCATNLHQIYLAVQLYRNDEGMYPASLAALLDDGDNLADYANDVAVANTGGKGYFKGGKEALVCADDDTVSDLPRSSYGDISVDTTADPQDDMGRFVWNYWGYRAKADTSACGDADAADCMGTQYKLSDLQPYGSTTLLAPNYETVFGDARYHVGADTSNPVDVTKLPRLANRFAPPSTIITHCVYHRLPTSNAKEAYDIYNGDGSGQGAKDIVLLLNGSAKVLDVTSKAFIDDEAWAKQQF